MAMTDNQLMSLVTDLYNTTTAAAAATTTTTNNNNNNQHYPLTKYDLYALSLSTSVTGTGANALFASCLTNNNHQYIVNNNNNNNNNSNNNNIVEGNTTYSVNSSQQSQLDSASLSNTVMLTNAITIPRTSNNPQHSHHLHNSSNFYPHQQYQTQNLNQYQQQQQQQQQQQNIINQNNSSMATTNMMSSITTTNGSQQQQQQQQQQQTTNNQHQSNSTMSTDLNDYSDYGLDALDNVSLPPSLLQDVSLSAATPSLTMGQNATNSVSSTHNFVYAQDSSSPLSINQKNTEVGSVSNAEINRMVSFLSSTAGTDDPNSTSLLYDNNVTNGDNQMIWNDMGGGGTMAITKSEPPFMIEDDYIFTMEKNDINDFTDTTFNDLSDSTFLLEELLHSTADTYGNGCNSLMLETAFNQSSDQAVTPSPGHNPPMELMQQQKQQQQQLQQSFTQMQNMQNSIRMDSGVGSSFGNSLLTPQQQQQQRQQQQQNRQANHQSSSTPYDMYHRRTPNKHHLHNTITKFSPESQSSHSPLQINSKTSSPSSHNTQRHQYPHSLVKARNMPKKGFFVKSEGQNAANLLGHSAPGTQGLLMSGQTLSPGNGSGSGFGGTTNGATVSVSVNGNSRKPLFLPVAADDEASMLARLSSSAPTGQEHIWMRREPRQHLLSTGSLAEAESFSSLSTGSVLSPDRNDYSHDDEDDNTTDDNSDHYDDDLSSDNGSENDDDNLTVRLRSNSMNSQYSSSLSSKNKERCFWMYNVQAKGPKGKRLVFQSKLEDPHILNEVTDPVFSPNCSVKGIKVYKHSGKARKGDGNDLTPNPRKLHNIGKELDRLSRTINDMTPVSELPFNARPKSRKEKNKLASRACRLKKKAQHEANKIKLYGLEIEHKRLLSAIAELKQTLVVKYRKQTLGEGVEEVDQQIAIIYQNATTGFAIAGITTDFVNKVLENVKNGQPSGGLDELKHL